MTKRVPFLLAAPLVVPVHACIMHSYRHYHHQPINRLTLPAMDMVEPYGRPQVMALAISLVLLETQRPSVISLANVTLLHLAHIGRDSISL
ncbi:hypothetical protein BAE44_0024232 [Dichanthelium oligosanthes]|uniref:Secreted protein n=1 Tax=Dichanthelium oligosanthes TaxID=888268 RepID=A0A1E5UPC4_9POAL|nr:hypothetical protein BAE44_0024232 [Dichanthelium oligosanthes]